MRGLVNLRACVRMIASSLAVLVFFLSPKPALRPCPFLSDAITMVGSQPEPV